MKAEYYKDAQSVAEAIHNLQFGGQNFEDEDEAREEQRRVCRKMRDFVAKWFETVCEENRKEAPHITLLTLHIDVGERVDQLFNEMIYARRRERNKRRATELLVE